MNQNDNKNSDKSEKEIDEKREAESKKEKNKKPKEEEITNNTKENAKLVIYLGPNIPGGILNNGSVFNNGLPISLNELLEEVPEIKKLIVNVDEITVYKNLLAKKGSEQSRIFQSIINKTRNDKRGSEL